MRNVNNRSTIRVLQPTQHIIGHFGESLSSQSIALTVTAMFMCNSRYVLDHIGSMLGAYRGFMDENHFLGNIREN